jgi:hypothetical protein
MNNSFAWLNRRSGNPILYCSQFLGMTLEGGGTALSSAVQYMMRGCRLFTLESSCRVIWPSGDCRFTRFISFEQLTIWEEF